jgi:hypothetical protein
VTLIAEPTWDGNRPVFKQKKNMSMHWEIADDQALALFKASPRSLLLLLFLYLYPLSLFFSLQSRPDKLGRRLSPPVVPAAVDVARALRHALGLELAHLFPERPALGAPALGLVPPPVLLVVQPLARAREFGPAAGGVGGWGYCIMGVRAGCCPLQKKTKNEITKRYKKTQPSRSLHKRESLDLRGGVGLDLLEPEPEHADLLLAGDCFLPKVVRERRRFAGDRGHVASVLALELLALCGRYIFFSGFTGGQGLF